MKLLSVRIAMILLLSLGALAQPVAAKPPSAQAATRELERVQAEIRVVTQAVQDEVARRDRVAASLRAADVARTDAEKRLEAVRLRRLEALNRHRGLVDQTSHASAALSMQRAALAADLRAIYAQGSGSELKMLLSVDDPAALSRGLGYAGVLTRAREARIRAIQSETNRLTDLDAALRRETDQLAALEAERAREAQALDLAKAEQQRALSALQATVASRTAALNELKANAASLEDLLTRLKRALRDKPATASAHRTLRGGFAALKGRMPWPVAGKIASRFGDARAAGLKWTGLVLETAAHAEVRAPAAGRVIFANWLPGLGLLLILDHGEGYLTLYGYNASLTRSVGDTVSAGAVLGVTGSGEGGRSTLYFEVRDGTHPLDPARFLRAGGGS